MSLEQALAENTAAVKDLVAHLGRLGIGQSTVKTGKPPETALSEPLSADQIKAIAAAKAAAKAPKDPAPEAPAEKEAVTISALNAAFSEFVRAKGRDAGMRVLEAVRLVSAERCAELIAKTPGKPLLESERLPALPPAKYALALEVIKSHGAA